MKRPPDACVFITPYPIAPSVWDRFHKLSKDLDRHNIEVVDGSSLLDLIQRHLPDFLDHFSMEVRYRYELERYLNRIPESILAFGLTTELQLDNLYVDASLCDSDRYFDLVATRPASSQEPTFVVVEPDEISHLEDTGAWWGANAEIIDPPRVETEEQKREVSRLQQSIPKNSNKRVIQLNLDPLIKRVQERLRDSLVSLSEISSGMNEDECTRLASRFIGTQEKLRDLRDFKPVWDNWLHFVKQQSEPEWVKPQIQIPSSLLLKINCNKYILGEPGVGKTTLLRRLAQNLSRSSKDVLPIFLPLALVKEPSREALVQACIQQLETQGYTCGEGRTARSRFLSKASSGAVQLFLDGLDEVGSGADELMSAIEQLASDHPQCRITLSCRSTFEAPLFHGAIDLKITPFSDN